MSRIHVLSEEVANQIAAGEVVERPVSIIKELIENSLDAGANKIEVTFRHGGKYYMSVLDNGSGMTPEEASLCLERHATSKLNYASDLNTICSFGFRGEALPSIASVSRFNLRTRYKEEAIGTEILVNGGKLLHKKEIGMPIGTQIEVLNLFNTVPARRKFMKSEATESAHIINLVRLYAIAHRDISFTLYERDRELFKVAGSNSLKDRVKAVWGKRLIEDLTEFKAEEEGLRAYGLLSKPGIGRSTRQEMIIIVNGRPVDCKTISYALIESYHTYVPKGRYPVLFFNFFEQEGRSACSKWRSVISLPLLLKYSIKCKLVISSSCIPTLKKLAIAFFVKSSLVGPKPPVVIMMSFISESFSSVSMIEE